MSDQIQKQMQQLQSDVLILKARLFDHGEALTNKENEVNQYKAVVNDIVKLLRIEDTGQGVTADAILEAIAALVPAVDDAVEGELLQG